MNQRKIGQFWRPVRPETWTKRNDLGRYFLVLLRISFFVSFRFFQLNTTKIWVFTPHFRDNDEKSKIVIDKGTRVTANASKTPDFFMNHYGQVNCRNSMGFALKKLSWILVSCGEKNYIDISITLQVIHEGNVLGNLGTPCTTANFRQTKNHYE